MTPAQRQEAPDPRAHHVAEYERAEKARAGEPRWLADLRERAIQRFAELGFPTTRDEAWKYTSVAPIVATAWRAPAAEAAVLAREQVAAHAIPGLEAVEAVFVNGKFAPHLSKLGSLPSGVSVESLAGAIEKRPAEIEPFLASAAKADEAPFTALNTALFQDGAYVRVPAGVVVEIPIHLIFVSVAGREPTASHPRVLLVVGENAQATVIETYAGEGHYFTNAVTEIVAAESAVVEHVKIETESDRASHVADTRIRAARAASVTDHSVAFGGALVRNHLGAWLGGEGAHATLNGLFVVDGKQHVDNHTRLDHAEAHCTSREVYKGILDGHARGVFTGLIHVHPDAQKTDSKQTNKNLLLSDHALMDSTPQLEIFADDVKCTHGSTIGQLDDEAMFYLRARGIGAETARAMLTHAFAAELIAEIKVPALRERLDAMLLAKMGER